MRILVLPPRDVRFPDHSPWRALLDGLRLHGHEIEDFGALSGRPDALVTLNDQPAARAAIAQHSIPPARAALVVLEPPVTSPSMYRHQCLRLYGQRFAASPLWASAIGGDPFRWPQSLEAGNSFRESPYFRATMVNGDKRSAIRGSLYGLRRSVIRACAVDGISLALFGPGWGDGPVERAAAGAKSVVRAMIARQWPDMAEAFGDVRLRPASWHGSVESKAAALALAPMSIVIENSSDYVSEKLIDAVCAGVVPVYVGPSLAQFDLPEDIAMHVAPSTRDIVATIAMASDERINEVRQAGVEWLQSTEARRHDITEVLLDLGKTIGKRLG